ncbi:MAG: polysaccharide biosynthesis protein [Lewinellaceae bacterium]|nr:polysaccharide biosynthesis protein [Lewinellaceae bacterium]MCB9352804.1 polysaccharide biosynthesis protein [Lewinellaceae bacterium]
MNISFGLFNGKQEGIAGYVTKLLILAVDFTFALFAFFAALLITCKFDLSEALEMFGWATALVLFLRAAAFVVFKTYLIIIRYVGERDYKNVFFAVTLSSICFWVLLELFPGLLPAEDVLPIVLVDGTILLLLAGGFRILLRLIFDQVQLQRGSRLNTVIFGAGELGAMLLRVLRHNGSHNYRVVAFFDDNPKVHKKSLNGVKVFNPEKAFAKVVRKHDIKVAVIGINQLPEERRIQFINNCLANHVKVLKVPPTENWLNDSLNIGQLRDIRFEDLLNRPPILLNEDSIQKSVTDKVVLVTGCAGSIGSEIVRQLLRFRPQCIIGLDQAETPLAEISIALQKEVESGLFHPIIGDVKDYDKMQSLFEMYKPEYVFHAAAYKHVPIMERFPAEAVKANVQGTQNIANLASRFGARKFVMISTDKVVNPGNVMGASKRIAEIYVQSLNSARGNNTQFITTRFGNVLGSNGSVIPIFKQQIENRQPVTVTHPDVTRFFMTIPEACQLVLEAGAMGKGGEIFIFDMGKPVRIVELAEKMIQMAGLALGKDIQIKFTGLRPGEKLNEELLDEQEGVIATHHSKIRKANVRHYDHYEVRSQIHNLVEMAYTYQDSHLLVKLMKEIVPEFMSQNSDFAELDDARNEPASAPGKEKG